MLILVFCLNLGPPTVVIPAPMQTCSTGVAQWQGPKHKGSREQGKGTLSQLWLSSGADIPLALTAASTAGGSKRGFVEGTAALCFAL